jgi:DNA mismatch endonuclease (patch repair protein)
MKQRRASPLPETLLVDADTSARLSRIRQRDTAPEIAVRVLLQGLGVRYRVNNRDLPGSPDIANRKRRWAIFVHGCFWHAHEGCRRATVPTRNRRFWKAKFAANRVRDARVAGELRRQGFRVVVIWACELDETPTIVVRRLMKLKV